MDAKMRRRRKGGVRGELGRERTRRGREREVSELLRRRALLLQSPFRERLPLTPPLEFAEPVTHLLQHSLFQHGSLPSLPSSLTLRRPLTSLADHARLSRDTLMRIKVLLPFTQEPNEVQWVIRLPRPAKLRLPIPFHHASAEERAHRPSFHLEAEAVDATYLDIFIAHYSHFTR